MTLLKFNHALLKTPVQVVDSQLFSFHHSPASNCTYLLGSGGAIIPVSETVEQVAALLGTIQQEQSIKGKREK